MSSSMKLIGGVKASDAEKQWAITLIKNAIKANNGSNAKSPIKPVKISNATFAKTYPEGLELVKEYYDSLYYASALKLKSWDDKGYESIEIKRSKLKSAVRASMKETLLIFTPKLIDMDELEIRKRFHLSFGELSTIFLKYNRFLVLNDENSFVDLEKKMIESIYDEIVINGLKKHEFCVKYNVSDHLVDKFIKLLKRTDQKRYDEIINRLHRDSIQMYTEVKDLVSDLFNYVENKIEVKDLKIKMSFTNLDYYSMTNISLESVIDYLRAELKINDVDMEYYAKGRNLLSMLLAEQDIGYFMSKEQFLQKAIMAGTVDGMVKLNKNICNRIFDIFEKEGIPTTSKLLETAFYRYALGRPILPLKGYSAEVLNEEDYYEISIKNKG